MTRYADPRRCPDCRSAITPGDAACGTCGLSLRGETAQRLFSTLILADELLRAAAGGVGAGPGRFRPDHVRAPRRARLPPEPRRSRLGAASVPKILLGPGGRLPAGGGPGLPRGDLVGAGRRRSHRRPGGPHRRRWRPRRLGGPARLCGPRRSRCPWWASGCSALDVVGAERAGWFGDLSFAGFLVLLGAVLLARAAPPPWPPPDGHDRAARRRRDRLGDRPGGAHRRAGRHRVARHRARRWCSAPWCPPLAVAAARAAGAAPGGGRRRRSDGAGLARRSRCTAWGGSPIADVDWRTLWLGLDVWPLLAAAALVAALALVRRLPLPARVGAAAVAHLLLVVAVLAPLQDLGATGLTLVALAVLAGTAVATWWLPRSLVAGEPADPGRRRRGRAARRRRRWPARRWPGSAEASVPVWSGSAGDRLPAAPGRRPARRLAAAAVRRRAGRHRLGAAAPSAARRPRRRHLRVPAGGAWGAAVLAGSLVLALALYPVPRVARRLGAGARGHRLHGVVAAPSERPVLLALAAGLRRRRRRPRSARRLAHGRCPGPADGRSAHVVHLRARADAAGRARRRAARRGRGRLGVDLGRDRRRRGDLGGARRGGRPRRPGARRAPYAPDRWWRAAHPVPARAGLEVGAALAAVAASVAGLEPRPGERDRLVGGGLPHRARRRRSPSCRCSAPTGGHWAGSAACCWPPRAGCGWPTSACTPPRPTRCRPRPCCWSSGSSACGAHPGSSTTTTLAPGTLARRGAEPAVGARRADRAAGAVARARLPGRWCWSVLGWAGRRRSCSERSPAPSWCCGSRRRTSRTRCRAGC